MGEPDIPAMAPPVVATKSAGPVIFATTMSTPRKIAFGMTPRISTSKGTSVVP